MLEFSGKDGQSEGEMCIFDNPLFYAEIVACFYQKNQAEFLMWLDFFSF